MLKAAQKGNAKVYSLIQENDTRWNSSYDMLNRFIKLQEHVDTVVRENGSVELVQLLPDGGAKVQQLLFQTSVTHTHSPTSQERLMCYALVLKLMKDFTEFAEGEGITLPHVPARIHALLTALSPNERDAPFTKSVKVEMHAAVSNRLGILLTESNLALLAAAVHPTHGRLDFIRPQLREKVCLTSPSFPLTR